MNDNDETLTGGDGRLTMPSRLTLTMHGRPTTPEAIADETGLSDPLEMPSPDDCRPLTENT